MRTDPILPVPPHGQSVSDWTVWLDAMSQEAAHHATPYTLGKAFMDTGEHDTPAVIHAFLQHPSRHIRTALEPMS